VAAWRRRQAARSWRRADRGSARRPGATSDDDASLRHYADVNMSLRHPSQSLAHMSSTHRSQSVTPSLAHNHSPMSMKIHCHTVTLSRCHTVILSYCHARHILSYCHTPSCYWCHTVTLSHCHTTTSVSTARHCHNNVILSYHTVILPYCLQP
jgi:hypothetical protein